MKNNKVLSYIIFILLFQMTTIIVGQNNFSKNTKFENTSSQRSISAQRVLDGLQVVYDFSEGSGISINDNSNVGSPLNLTLTNINSVSWKSPGLTITGEMNIKSSTAASKIITACKASNEVTYEAWFFPTDTLQRGIVARIMAMTFNDVHTTNIKFWQSGNDFGFHCRTSVFTCKWI